MAALALAAPLVAHAFDLQGHRGARGLMPENTLPAFAAALSLGVTTLELDVGLTKDGVVVVAHDRTLNPDLAKGPDGRYVQAPAPSIRALTLAQVQAYDVGTLRPGSRYAAQFPAQTAVPGTRMPTLAELAALIDRAGNADVRVNVETKLSPLAPDETADPEIFAAALVAALRETGLAERATIQSFDWRTLAVVQRIAPEIPTVCLTIAQGQNDTVQIGKAAPSPFLAGRDVAEFNNSVPALADSFGCAVWSPFYRDLTLDALAEAKVLGLAVVVWTVNEPAEMARLVDLGVDGIITDYPDRLRAVLLAKDIALPPPTPVAP